MRAQLPKLQGRHTANESVAEALRVAVLSGSLEVGTRLVQAELAAEFGVSNTPVREAMRQLAAEGLIQFDSFRGAIVRAPSLDEVREVYEIRLLLEPLSMRKAVDRITPDELEQAEQLQREMIGVDDVGAWVLLNRRFHGLLADAARSPRLARVIGGLQDAATSQVALSIKADLRRLTDGNDEHLEILQAMRDRDADRAAELITSHLTSTVRAVESLALSSHAAADD